MTERDEVERLKNDLSLCKEGNAQAVELLIERAGEIAALRANRCDDCGANIYSGPPDCPLCGAPNCCQQCCRINHLRREVERLTKEKTGRFNYVKSSHPHFYPFGDGECYFCRMLCENEEIAALKAKLAEVENHRMERAISILKNIDPPAKGWIEVAVHNRFIDALRGTGKQ